MKNLHLIPTDKPSRLAGIEYITNVQGTDKRVYNFRIWDKFISNKELKDVGYIPQHIYITNDEVIKVGDWVIEFQKNDKIGEVHFINGEYVIAKDIQKKIILTTDQDLINDGVQAIDEEFLEWFVKNPTCEEVEIEECNLLDISRTYLGIDKYKIIIPKEESKYPIGGFAFGYYSCICMTCKAEFIGDKLAIQCEPCAINTEQQKELSSRLFNVKKKIHILKYKEEAMSNNKHTQVVDFSNPNADKITSASTNSMSNNNDFWIETDEELRLSEFGQEVEHSVKVEAMYSEEHMISGMLFVFDNFQESFSRNEMELRIRDYIKSIKNL